MRTTAAPSPEQTARTLVARCAQRSEARARHEAALRTVLPELAAALRARGARRIYLFGSLAWGGAHEGSDIDLAVEGLSTEARADAWLEAEQVSGAHVDLLLLERLPPSFRERIEREGVRL